MDKILRRLWTKDITTPLMAVVLLAVVVSMLKLVDSDARSILLKAVDSLR